MAALSYNPSLLCSVFPSNSAIMMPGSLQKGDFNTSTSSLFPHSFPSGHFQQILNQVVDAEGITDPATQMMTPAKRKRKCRDESCLSSAISKDSNSNRGKGKKQRDYNSCNFSEAENSKSDDGKNNQKRGIQEDQNGFVYVRARRGEATDRHSLAERVRRERISERLNILQSLVPGCDKMCSKALMLDEIISYVQSLQRQVEFLSMKLAYTNLMTYDTRRDIFSMAKPEKPGAMATPLASAEVTPPLDTATTYPLTDTSVLNFQDKCDLLWGC